MWVAEEEAERRLPSGDRTMGLSDSRSRACMPLYLFDFSVGPCDMIPNLDSKQPIPRQAHELKFLLRRRGLNITTKEPACALSPGLEHFSKAAMAGSWGPSSINREFTG